MSKKSVLSYFLVSTGSDFLPRQKKKKGEGDKSICELVFIGAFSPAVFQVLFLMLKIFLKNVKYNVFTVI